MFSKCFQKTVGNQALVLGNRVYAPEASVGSLGDARAQLKKLVNLQESFCNEVQAWYGKITDSGKISILLL